MIRKDVPIGDLAAGKAGEYLVCADLILQGHIAFPSEQGLPFDVVADFGGRLFRVQVKTTKGTRPIPQRTVHTPVYLFHIKRCGKGGKRTYGNGDVDLFALVSLDTRTVGYLPTTDVRRTMLFRAEAHRGTYFDERMTARNDIIRSDRATGLSLGQLASKHDIDKAAIGRICARTEERFATGQYLSDLTLDRALGAAK